MKPRHICYVTGTRADFGLMASTLRQIHTSISLKLSLLVTGMHLSEKYGLTVQEIEREGFDILAKVPCNMEQTDGAQMAINLGQMLQGFVHALKIEKPDFLLLLGDRGEMLAGALAASHLDIPIVHLHGGELSGTIDESIRHAISKLAHIHLVSTTVARARLIRMGELPENVHTVGAPGLDGLTDLVTKNREQLCASEGLNPDRKLALLIFHPVLQEAGEAAAQIEVIAQTLCDTNYQVLALMPNSDSGSDEISRVLSAFQHAGQFVNKIHLERQLFVTWMSCVDVMIGNSSSGIIEAASFGTPVLNLGTRQNRRERNSNVYDAPIDSKSMFAALTSIGKRMPPPFKNIYGDGLAGKRIVNFLMEYSVKKNLLNKCNAY